MRLASRLVSFFLSLFAALPLLAPAPAAADDPTGAVVAPPRDGEVRSTEPVEVAPLDPDEAPPLPAPNIVPDGGAPGANTVPPYTGRARGRTTLVPPPPGGFQTPSTPPPALPPPALPTPALPRGK